MCLRGMAARTQEAYIGAVADLARYYRRSPADLGAEEVQAYLLHLIRDQKLAYASVNQASCAFRFLYRRVLDRPEASFDIPMAKEPKRLPQILSREEVARLIDSARMLRGRTVLMTPLRRGPAGVGSLRPASGEHRERARPQVPQGSPRQRREGSLHAALAASARGPGH